MAVGDLASNSIADAGTERGRWMVEPGAKVELDRIDTAGTDGAPGGKPETSATFVELRGRLEDPTKRWKFRCTDLDERARWGEYMEAYEEAIERTSTEAAPWYVIPADHKWYRNWAIRSSWRSSTT